MEVRNKMKLAVRPYLGVAVLLALSLAVAAGSAWKMNEAGREVRDGLASERLVSDWAGNIISNVKRTTVLVESADPKLVSLFADDVAASSKRNTELMKKVESVLDTEEERRLFARIAENRKAYQASRDTAFKLLAEGRGKQAYKALEAQYKEIANRYQNMVTEFLQLERRQVNVETHAVAQEGTFAAVAGVAALAALLIACSAWWRKRGTQAAPQAPAQADAPHAWDEFYDILA